MDLLHHKECDGFCIVSSDSDFIGLALRIRRVNIPVYGFGNANSIKEFRQACTEFFEIPSTSGNAIQSNATQVKLLENKKFTANQLKCDTKLLNALRDGISNNKPDKDGWVNYAIFSSYLKNNHPNIKAENYGYQKFYEIIDQIDLFEGKKENSTVFIRHKPTKDNNNNQNNANQQWPKEKLLQDIKLMNAIKESITKNLDNGWTNSSSFTQYLNTNYPNIKPKNYGYAKWRTLVEKVGLFEIKIFANVMRIRIKGLNTNTGINTTLKKSNQPKIITKSLKCRVMSMIHHAPSSAKDKYGYTELDYISQKLFLMNIDIKDYNCIDVKDFLKRIGCILRD